MDAHLYTSTGLPLIGYVARLLCPPAALEDVDHRAVGRALSLARNSLGRRWHLELTTAGGARFGSALACVTACRVRAAITTMPAGSSDVARLDVGVQAKGSLADVADGGSFPKRWDAPPLAFDVESVAHAARDVPAVHAGTDFEEVFTSARPQTVARRVMDSVLKPEVLRTVLVRRLLGGCPDIGDARCETAWGEWGPSLRAAPLPCACDRAPTFECMGHRRPAPPLRRDGALPIRVGRGARRLATLCKVL